MNSFDQAHTWAGNENYNMTIVWLVIERPRQISERLEYEKSSFSNWWNMVLFDYSTAVFLHCKLSVCLNMYPYIYIKEGLNKCLLNGVEAGRHITQGIF